MQTRVGRPRPTGRTKVEFSEFFLEDGPKLGSENLPDQGEGKGEEPPSSDEESCASSEHHSDNKSVDYSVEEYEREREGTWKREGGLSSNESESETRRKGLSLSWCSIAEDAKDAHHSGK